MSHQKMAKSLLGLKAAKDATESTWRKKGGYLRKGFEQKIKAHGFTRVGHDHTGNADGSHMGGKTHYEHPDGHHLTVHSSYGATAHNNWHYATLRTKAKTNEEAPTNAISTGAVAGYDPVLGAKKSNKKPTKPLRAILKRKPQQ